VKIITIYEKANYLMLLEEDFFNTLTLEALDITAKAFTEGILALFKSGFTKVSALALANNLTTLLTKPPKTPC
jgi:hypothetical protein